MGQDGVAVMLVVAVLVGLVAWFVNDGLSNKNQREFRHVYLGVQLLVVVLAIVGIVFMVK